VEPDSIPTRATRSLPSPVVTIYVSHPNSASSRGTILRTNRANIELLIIT
jgi:hypothetical protein